MLLEVILILLLSNSIQCSVVVDAVSQNGIYIADYCPKMKNNNCEEGSHVMCMYYNPNRVMGPRCRNARNVSMTAELANKLIDVTNAVRSKIARGKEKGKNGEPLPRGYGIFRLKWDSELATFAQVLANQCVLRHDLCRATKKFSDPGQTAGLVRFSIKDWFPISKSGNFTKPGLDDEKLLYATIQSLKSWYTQKSSVTAQMVTNYPDWAKTDPTRSLGRLYLEMIYGAATHMGCGISAYAEYAFYDNISPLNYNSIQVICNFSARPKKGAAVYNTVPPADSTHPFNSCGCPTGSMEDDDCLCLEVQPEPQPMHLLGKTETCPMGMNCDPTVVLLPIFTVEDAPPEKLITPQRLAKTSVGRMARTKMIDSFEELFHINVLSENKKNILESHRNIHARPDIELNGHNQRPAPYTRKAVTVRNRHFDGKPNELTHYEGQNQHEDKHTRMKQTQSHLLRPSVFAKIPRFELPGTQHFMTSIKRDVTPRKDFSTGKKLVNKYLYNIHSILLPKTQTNTYKNTMSELNDIKSVENVGLNNELHNYIHPIVQKNNSQQHKSHSEDLHFHDLLTKENVLNTAEQRIINQNKYFNDLNQSHDYNKPENNTFTEESDKKFMALLDTLEQEVKHVELRDKEKQIFDAKIKKIYGKVVGKPSNALTITDRTSVVLMNKDGKNKYKENSRFRNEFPKTEASYTKLEYENPLTIEQPNSHREHVDETDFNENYPKLPESNLRRNRNSMRQMNHNQIDSNEILRYRSENALSKRMNPYRNDNVGRNVARNNNEKLIHRSNSLDYKRTKKYYGNDAYQDLLSAERRKYYQNMLESVERKLQGARRLNRRKDAGRSLHMRTMRTSVRSDNQMNSLYTSGRARFLHGY